MPSIANPPSRVAALLLALALAACQGGGPSDADKDYAARMAEAHANDSPVANPVSAERPALEVASEAVVYGTVKGRAARGHLAYPLEAHGALPAILVFHEWWGLNDNVKAAADRLAGQGYVVLAVDLYGGEVAATPEAAQALMMKSLEDDEAVGQNVRAAYTYLETQTPASAIATLGWCFGGAMSFRTATMFPDKVAATVIYYGQVASDPTVLEPLQMPILAFFGGKDAHIPVAGAREFEAALHRLGKDAEVRIYEGAGHAFANPSGTNYQKDAADDSWQRTLAFLDEHLNQAIYQAPSP
jgi:carboxymethylenebutenolidase